MAKSARLGHLQDAEVGQQADEGGGLALIPEDGHGKGLPAHIDDVGPEDIGPSRITSSPVWPGPLPRTFIMANSR